MIDEFKDIGKIANMMADWKGDIADALELPYPEREKIMEANRGNLGEQKYAKLNVDAPLQGTSTQCIYIIIFLLVY